MATKLNSKRASLVSPTTPVDSSSSLPFSFSSTPPTISSTTELLAFSLTLPDDYCIAYTQLRSPPGTPLTQSLADIERARFDIVCEDEDKSIQDSLLSYVQLLREDASLWIFAIVNSANGDSEVRIRRLESLSFRGLENTGFSQFTYQDVYHCSCSGRLNPCQSCLHSLSGGYPAECIPLTTPESTKQDVSYDSHHKLIEESLRLPYTFLIKAVRLRMIDDICRASVNTIFPDAHRLQNGFVFGNSTAEADWSNGWDNSENPQALVHYIIAVSLYPKRIVFHLHPKPTQFFPLLPSLPLPPGSPITLLPVCKPAFYLNEYTGPTDFLIKQFDLSFRGLGAGYWCQLNQGFREALQRTPTRGSPPTRAKFIIGWVSVENKNGEDKGIIIIWPAKLCLTVESFIVQDAEGTKVTTYANNRHQLPYIPDLPVPLQASPVPTPATVRKLSQTSPIEQSASVNPLQDSSMDIGGTPEVLNPSESPSLMRLRSNNYAGMAQVFRNLTSNELPVTHLNDVASNVASFVDSVAKERERERERIRIQREAAAQSPKMQHSVPLSHSTETANPILQTNLNQELSSPWSLDFPPNSQDTTEPLSAGALENNMVSTSLPISPTNLGATREEHFPQYLGPQGGTINQQVNFGSFADSNGDWSQNPVLMQGFEMQVDNDQQIVVPERAIQNVLIGHDLDAFGAFTDDDFSFFDGPTDDMTSLPSGPGLAHSVININVDSLAANTIPLELPSPLFHQPISSVDHSSTSPSHFVSPWTPGILTAPPFEDHEMRNAGLSSRDLPILSPNPLSSPSPYPLTPAVHINSIMTTIHQPSSPTRPSTFDPIPFTDLHRTADSKYTIGKFALPSPPDSEDRTSPLQLMSTKPSDWKNSYLSATDPSPGVVKMLIRAKSKRGQETGSRPSDDWHNEYKEWSNSIAADREETPQASDVETEASESLMDEEEFTASRSSTPPPYLPLGPSLPSTGFLHFILLPISSNLRPPGAAFSSPDPVTSASMSVPTPVSPAAALGVQSEYSKSLESAAQILATEIVENHLWAQAWHMQLLSQSWSKKQNDPIRESDFQCIKKMLWSQKMAGSLLTVGRMVGFSSSTHNAQSSAQGQTSNLQLLDYPRFNIGKGDSVIRILPPGLRFWDKLGLGPHGGKKDVLAFALFQVKDDSWISQVDHWMSNVSSVYESKGYGLHTKGNSTLCSAPGLVPIRLDAARKIISKLLQELASIPQMLILYVITPTSILNLRSPVLRHILLALKYAIGNHEEKSVRSHLVLEDMVISCAADSPKYMPLKEEFTHSVYNRLYRPIRRPVSNHLIPTGEKIRRYFEAPAYVLSSTVPHKVHFGIYSPIDLSVVERHTFLHVGYQISGQKKWILAACIDEKGHTHDVGTWLTPNEFSYEHVVSQVWSFTLDFLRKVNAECRVAIAKLGAMHVQELAAWDLLLSKEIPNSRPVMHASILCVEVDAWTICVNSQAEQSSSLNRPSNRDRNSVVVDGSSNTYMLTSLIHCPLSPANCEFGADHDRILEEEEESKENVIFPKHTSVLIQVPSPLSYERFPGPACSLLIHFLSVNRSHSSTYLRESDETHRELTKNYHDLAVLTQERWKFKAVHALPFHLAALQSMEAALERGDNIVE